MKPFSVVRPGRMKPSCTSLREANESDRRGKRLRFGRKLSNFWQIAAILSRTRFCRHTNVCPLVCHIRPRSGISEGVGVNESNTELRVTADRRESERRRKVGERPERVAPEQEQSLAITAGLDVIRRLTAALEAIAVRAAAHQSEKHNDDDDRPTCTVPEAARLLGTTPGGIYALYERGKLPRSVGPGRRLVFLRDELLQCARRVSPSGGRGR